MAKKVKFWEKFWEENQGRITSALLTFLEKKLVKLAMEKLLIASGIRLWLIKFVAENLVKQGDQHIIEPLFRKMGYETRVMNGKRVYERRIDSKDLDEWRDSIRNR